MPNCECTGNPPSSVSVPEDTSKNVCDHIGPCTKNVKPPDQKCQACLVYRLRKLGVAESIIQSFGRTPGEALLEDGRLPHHDREHFRGSKEAIALFNRAMIFCLRREYERRKPAPKGSFVIGECHGDIAPVRCLIENMPDLAQQGYKIFYLEHIPRDLFPDISPMTCLQDIAGRQKLNSLCEYLDIITNRHRHGREIPPEEFRYKYSDLVVSALANGIKVIGLDTVFTYAFQGDADRHAVFTYKAYDVLSIEDKWFALTGDSHATFYGGTSFRIDPPIPGIQQIAKVQACMIYDTYTASRPIAKGTSLGGLQAEFFAQLEERCLVIKSPNGAGIPLLECMRRRLTGVLDSLVDFSLC